MVEQIDQTNGYVAYDYIVIQVTPNGICLPPPPPPPLSDASARAAYAVTIYKGMPTDKGDSNGCEACAWALQQIQAGAGLKPLANGSHYVPTIRDWLAAGNGYQVPQGSTVKGDIWIQGDGDPIRGENHIGICEDDGCHTVISNEGGCPTSAGPAVFGWEDSPANYEAYYAGHTGYDLPGGFWHVTAAGT